MSKWINCSDRLPRRFGKYLVAMRDSLSDNHYIGLKAYYPQEHEWSDHEDEILAWMPIPEYRRK